jgi:hypothetical protein
MEIPALIALLFAGCFAWYLYRKDTKRPPQ